MHCIAPDIVSPGRGVCNDLVQVVVTRASRVGVCVCGFACARVSTDVDPVVTLWLQEKESGAPYLLGLNPAVYLDGNHPMPPAAATMPTTGRETELCPRSARAGWSSLE